MLRIMLGLFLAAHGLVHLPIWLPQAFGVRAAADPNAPFDPGYSWLLQPLGEDAVRWLSIGLAVVAAVAFVGAGAGLLAHQAWWRPLTVVAAGVSLTLVLVYFTPWLSAAVGINVALIIALVAAHWPSPTLVGA